MFDLESNQFLGGSEKITLLFPLAKENITSRVIKSNSSGRAEKGKQLFSFFLSASLLETLSCIQSHISMPWTACLQRSNFFLPFY